MNATATRRRPPAASRPRPLPPPLTAEQRQRARDNYPLVGFVRGRILARVPHVTRDDMDELTRHLEDALLAACRNYKPERGKFSTYAVTSMTLGGYKNWRYARDKISYPGTLSLDWRHPDAEGELDSPLELARRLCPEVPRQDLRDLRRAVRRLLPREEYLAVWLSSRGLIGREIAAKLGVHKETANLYLARARRRLARHRGRLLGEVVA